MIKSECKLSADQIACTEEKLKIALSSLIDPMRWWQLPQFLNIRALIYWNTSFDISTLSMTSLGVKFEQVIVSYFKPPAQMYVTTPKFHLSMYRSLDMTIIHGKINSKSHAMFKWVVFQKWDLGCPSLLLCSRSIGNVSKIRPLCKYFELTISAYIGCACDNKISGFQSLAQDLYRVVSYRLLSGCVEISKYLYYDARAL